MYESPKECTAFAGFFVFYRFNQCLMELPIGTFINMATVVLGSLIGLRLKQAFPERFRQIIFQAIGLGTMLVGIQMALDIQDPLAFIISMLLGGVLGEGLQLEKALQAWGEWLKKRLRIGDARFSDGLITAFLIFCVGSMTILGALNEGLVGNRELLHIKSVLDGVTSIALAASYGIGVLFSVVPMLLFQGSITLLAGLFGYLLIDEQGQFTVGGLLYIGQMKAVGGMLIVGISLNLLEIAKIRIANLLPALILVIPVTWAVVRILAYLNN